MGPRSTRSRVLMFLLLVLMMAVEANRDSTAAGFARTVSKAELLASPTPIPPDGNPDIIIRNRVVLSIANVFSVVVSLWPFFVRWRYGSWFITRQIFSAKVVACNLVASVTWTIYMMVQMYAGGNYAGDDVLLINSVSTTSSLFILLIYFLHGREDIKYWILMILFALVVCCGMGWLVWHPDIIVSERTQNILKESTKSAGITGIVLFGLVNFLPFFDLWAMTSSDSLDFSLITPIVINTMLACLLSAFWALYAWLFDPKSPNYFMIANSLVAGMTFIQFVWLLILRNSHREINNQIVEAESLRCVLLSVAKSLKRLGAAAPTEEFLQQTEYLLRLQEGLSIGLQSLDLMESTFLRLEQKLVAKVALTDAAHVLAIQGDQDPLAKFMATSHDKDAKNVLAACEVLRDGFKTSKNAFDEMQEAIEGKIANAEGSENNLRVKINAAAAAAIGLANFMGSKMQTINGGGGGIPPTVKIAFNFCYEQILTIKTCADAPFVWLGFGGFTLRRRLNLPFDNVNWPDVPL